MDLTKPGLLRSVSRYIRKLARQVKRRHHTTEFPVFGALDLPPDMMGDLPTDAQAALTNFCEAVPVAYGLQTWDRIRNDLRGPGRVQHPRFSPTDLLLMAERHSPLLYADKKIRAVTGSEPRT